jgi:hypothetical protein
MRKAGGGDRTGVRIRIFINSVRISYVSAREASITAFLFLFFCEASGFLPNFHFLVRRFRVGQY